MTLLTHEHCTCAQAAHINFATAANLTGRTMDPPMSPLEESRFLVYPDELHQVLAAVVGERHDAMVTETEDQMRPSSVSILRSGA